jgi:hypothetical protein
MFSPSVVLVTQEIIVYIFLDIFLGLIIPMQMEISWRTKAPQQASAFYVRKPVSLEPRRNDLELQYASHIANQTQKPKRKQKIPIAKSMHGRKNQNKRQHTVHQVLSIVEVHREDNGLPPVE